MFIRSIQLFERLFSRVARALTLAVAAVRAGRPLDAAAFLESAGTRLPGATAPLYRILTTMPPESFAVIRDHTHGASAIQSRPYQLVETVSAKREAGAHSPEKGPVFTLDATLQEAFLAHSGGWDTAETRRLEAAMRKLDAAWCGMKRTHWGVTMKIIGRVPGTGGTTGADYLKAAAQVPLFPLLSTD
jgi:tryptophan 2,3-dioxygenase